MDNEGETRLRTQQLLDGWDLERTRGKETAREHEIGDTEGRETDTVMAQNLLLDIAVTENICHELRGWLNALLWNTVCIAAMGKQKHKNKKDKQVKTKQELTTRVRSRWTQ